MNRLCEIDVKGLREELARGAVLVDVREYPEYAASRIAGARLIPLGEVDRRAEELDRSRPVYLVCRTGRRSGEAQRILAALGFEHAVNVAGGMTRWTAEGYPVIADRKAPWAIERQVRFVAGLLVVIGVVLGAFVAAPFAWLSGFVGAGLVFAAVTDSCLMGELIAKLPWNQAPTCAAEHGAPTEL